MDSFIMTDVAIEVNSEEQSRYLINLAKENHIDVDFFDVEEYKENKWYY